MEAPLDRFSGGDPRIEKKGTFLAQAWPLVQLVAGVIFRALVKIRADCCLTATASPQDFPSCLQVWLGLHHMSSLPCPDQLALPIIIEQLIVCIRHLPGNLHCCYPGPLSSLLRLNFALEAR